MLASDVISNARQKIGDGEDARRWSDAEMIGYLNRAQARLKRDCPEWLVVSGGLSVSTVTTIAAVGDTVVFNADSQEALALFVAHLARSTEDPDKQNIAAADSFLARYDREIDVRK
jgi:hypothetical protein